MIQFRRTIPVAAEASVPAEKQDDLQPGVVKTIPANLRKPSDTNGAARRQQRIKDDNRLL